MECQTDFQDTLILSRRRQCRALSLHRIIALSFEKSPVNAGKISGIVSASGRFRPHPVAVYHPAGRGLAAEQFQPRARAHFDGGGAAASIVEPSAFSLAVFAAVLSRLASLTASKSHNNSSRRPHSLFIGI